MNEPKPGRLAVWRVYGDDGYELCLHIDLDCDRAVLLGISPVHVDEERGGAVVKGTSPSVPVRKATVRSPWLFEDEASPAADGLL